MIAVAGKLGRIQSLVSGVTVAHELEDWSMELHIDAIEVPGFELTADPDGNIWMPHVNGLASGEVNFSGTYNTAKTPSASFKPGQANYTSLYLGISASVGFTVTGRIKSIGAGTNVKKQGTFKGTFIIEGVTTYPA